MYVNSGSERVKLYSLPHADFLLANAPDMYSDYRFPEAVNRPNFAPFVLEGFAIARGRPSSHREVLYSVRALTGFQWANTFNTFLGAGGWMTFSPSEKELIRGTMKRVEAHIDVRFKNGHSSLWMWSQSERLFSGEFNNYIDNLIKTPYFGGIDPSAVSEHELVRLLVKRRNTVWN